MHKIQKVQKIKRSKKIKGNKRARILTLSDAEDSGFWEMMSWIEKKR